MNTIKIAVVPEHFSTPWHYGIENNLFANAGINLELIEYGTGTGAMCRDLTTGIIDIAVVLTEGILKHQQSDPSIKIISQYVDTPLNWGVHVNNTSAFQTIADLKNARFGISRFGSGSHLMVKILAEQHHWDFEKLNFIEIGAIDLLGQAILNQNIEVFLWEALTTKPFYKRFNLRLLGTLLTPWPCFQIAVTAKLSQQTERLKQLLTILYSINKKFNSDPNFAAAEIKKFCHFSAKESLPWLNTVHWTDGFKFDKSSNS